MKSQRILHTFSPLHRSLRYAALAAFFVLGQACLQSTNATAQLIVAHRGASAAAPENTMRAFKLAWEQCADAVEADFHLTADKQIVCIHDKTTERVSGVVKNIADTTVDELLKLDVGRWKNAKFAGERMPTLTGILKSIPKDKIFFIEIKCGTEILPTLKSQVMESPLYPDQLRIISFHQEVIEQAKQLLPEISAYWLVDFQWDKEQRHWYPSLEKAIGIASRIGADGLDARVCKPVLEEKFARLCHQAGLSAHSWTVDDPIVARRLQELGFASITTNRPGLLQSALLQTSKTTASAKATSPNAETSTKEVKGVRVGVE